MRGVHDDEARPRAKAGWREIEGCGPAAVASNRGSDHAIGAPCRSRLPGARQPHRPSRCVHEASPDSIARRETNTPSRRMSGPARFDSGEAGESTRNVSLTRPSPSTARGSLTRSAT